MILKLYLILENVWSISSQTQLLSFFERLNSPDAHCSLLGLIYVWVTLTFRTFPHRVSSRSAQRSSGSYCCARWDFWHGWICHIHHQFPDHPSSSQSPCACSPVLCVSVRHYVGPKFVSKCPVEILEVVKVSIKSCSIKCCMIMWVGSWAWLKFQYHDVASFPTF